VIIECREVRGLGNRLPHERTASSRCPIFNRTHPSVSRNSGWGASFSNSRLKRKARSRWGASCLWSASSGQVVRREDVAGIHPQHGVIRPMASSTEPWFAKTDASSMCSSSLDRFATSPSLENSDCTDPAASPAASSPNLAREHPGRVEGGRLTVLRGRNIPPTEDRPGPPLVSRARRDGQDARPRQIPGVAARDPAVSEPGQAEPRYEGVRGIGAMDAARSKATAPWHSPFALRTGGPPPSEVTDISHRLGAELPGRPWHGTIHLPQGPGQRAVRSRDM
jgi:hypothetical protein